jgi:hypothetical protein
MGGVNYNLPVLNQFNTFTNQVVIDTASSTTAALRVTQRGAGNAIEVEDSTTPDSTKFVVDQFGKVGIGVAPSATAALKVDTNGIMFGDGTTQTTAATGGGGSGADIQTFTTAGTATWTKPAGKTMAWIRMWAGGSGGGSGARQATTVARGGGAGGGMGGFVEAWIPVSLLGTTKTVTVGAGGAGGTSIAVDSTNGSAGSTGGNSVFSIHTATCSNNFGPGGSSVAVSPGVTPFTVVNQSFIASTTNFANGGSGNITAGVAGAALDVRYYVSGSMGGGGGGAGASSVVTANGANGGLKTAFTNNTTSGFSSSVAGGTAGNATTPTAPTTGTSGVARYQGGTGGGGGGYKTATAGQAGAAGAQPGGGGGGGGASDNGFASGAGGAGGAGMVVVVCY